MIYIVAKRRFNKELLHYYLGSETSYTCLPVNALDDVAGQTKKKGCSDFLILLDFQCIEAANRCNLLFSSNGQPAVDLPLAIYNIPVGSNIEKKAMEAGVRGFFYENDQLEAMAKGIIAILAGEVWITRQKMVHCLLGKKDDQPADGSEVQALTPREEEILALVTRGFSNEKIAGHLYISPHTVKTHLYKTYKKIHVTDRLQAALWAVNHL
ncbi:MAG: response regulator transcription factor [Desulfobacterales bacterium]|nr:response regulator transcription factor [Desulfobacterales bacterium]